MKCDLYLLSLYIFRSPFKVSREYLKKVQSEEIYAYGETPLTSLEKIAKECGIKKKDKVFELGCGRGRTCFWFCEVLGSDVIGIDFNPEFIQKAQKVKNRFNILGVEFRCEDFQNSDLRGVTVIYLYGTCLKDEEIRNLGKKLSALPQGTKVITISFSIIDYLETNSYEILKRFSVKFPWGEGDVFLQLRK